MPALGSAGIPVIRKCFHGGRSMLFVAVFFLVAQRGRMVLGRWGEIVRMAYDYARGGLGSLCFSREDLENM